MAGSFNQSKRLNSFKFGDALIGFVANRLVREVPFIFSLQEQLLQAQALLLH